MAVRLAALVSILAVGYMFVAIGFGGRILLLLFGGSFRQFQGLAFPVATGQVFAATGVGMVLLLQASRRGLALVSGGGAGSTVMLVAAWVLGLHYGIRGAAWGLALGPLVTAIVLYAFGWPLRRSAVAYATDPLQPQTKSDWTGRGASPLGPADTQR
jgi:O-antigen/teichoic acid export membrane protein